MFDNATCIKTIYLLFIFGSDEGPKIGHFDGLSCICQSFMVIYKNYFHISLYRVMV